LSVISLAAKTPSGKAGNMKNRMFSNDKLEILLAPWSWRLMAPFLKPEVAAVEDRRHRDWLAGNSHCVPRISVLLPLRGKTVHGFEDKVFPCEPGLVFFFSPQTKVDIGCPPWSPDVDYLWLLITANELYACFSGVRDGKVKRLQNTVCMFGADIGISMFRHLAAIGHEERDPVLAKVLRQQLVATVAWVVSKLVALGCQKPETVDAAAERRQKLEMVRSHIEHTAGSGVRLDDLAQMSGYSKFHLVRLFRKHFGKSISAYINTCRVRRVQELVRRRMPMKAISAELGFANPSNFSRWHRKHRLPETAEWVS
jgi:AraC-like DNA-binding protein